MKQVMKTDWHRIVGYYLMGVAAGILGMIAMTRLIWHGKFYPGVVIGEVNVSGLSREQAKSAISKYLESYTLPLVYNGHNYKVSSNEFDLLMEQTLNQAYRVGRRANMADYAFVFVNKTQRFPLVMAEGTTDKYNQVIDQLSGDIEIDAQPAQVSLDKAGVVIVNGTDGLAVDQEKLNQLVRNRVRQLSSQEVEIPTKQINQRLSESELQSLKQRADKLSQSEIELKIEDSTLKLKGAELIALLDTNPGSNNLVNPNQLAQYVEGLSKSYDRDPQDARFEFANGKVTEFAPGRDGIKVNLQLTNDNLKNGIQELLTSDERNVVVEIAVERKSPQVTIDKLNELGIKERIGRGESYYAHSIANRIYNVSLAASRVNSTLVAPGEEFSFNQAVGEITGATGYKTAYVISGGRTVLGDGGGVCQVSTTVFRAAMNAGLPITERWAHAYRVGYYEQNSKAGIDATVYSPSKDLRFRNDTPGHILVQTINDPKNLHLIVEIYGTDDGRVSTVSEPVVTGITPPLPDVYQDDPTLPAGTTKQVDWAASGAHASFNYHVERDGQVMFDKTFVSNYQPWANVYLRGTAGQ